MALMMAHTLMKQSFLFGLCRSSQLLTENYI